MRIISRKEAKAQGLTRYYTGLPCVKGHITERMVSCYSCCACHHQSKKENSKRNPTGRNRRSRRYYSRNREKLISRVSEWRKRHKGECNASISKFRAGKAAPGWTERKEIKEFYKNCPKGFEVDHIIPLNGKEVSGLHVLANLQYLTKSENILKGNKFEPEFSYYNRKN